MPRVRRPGPPDVDGREQHRSWLALVDVDGPFLTLPVLMRVWPTLDPVDNFAMERLRDVHAYAADKPRAWIEFCVGELLDWQEYADWGPSGLGWTEPEHQITVAPDFTLGGPEQPYVLGYVMEPEQDPRGRVATDDWAATPTDRAAAACRALNVELALVTGGRLFCLVWAPRGGVTSVVTFDSATWSESADRIVVRAFVSLLGRRRFTAVPDADMLPALLRESLDAQEEITETLGVQIRRAAEQLVEAMGRWDAREIKEGRPGLHDLSPRQVYGGAVTMMMRLMFLFFAEERGLLPSDNPVYAEGYGASTLCERLERDAQEAGEEGIEYRTGAWLQLLATSTAVYRGVRSTRLRLEAYDGSLFDPAAYAWLGKLSIDDRTMLHVLRAVQYVEIKRERRRVSFRTLEVEQIGYVYEGLLAFDAVRAHSWVLGLIGKPGLEEEVELPELERLRATHTDLTTGILDHRALAADLAERYRDSRIGSVAKLTALLEPVTGAERTHRLQRLLAVTEGDQSLAERILPVAGLLRNDLRGLPLVVPAGSLYVTASVARAKSGTHYTPRTLAEQVTETALLPLVYATPGPLDIEDRAAWVPATSEQILNLKIADIAMGSGAFLVAACRFLAERLVEAWSREGHVGAADHLDRKAQASEVLHVDGLVDDVIIGARRKIISHCLYGVDINPMAVEMAKLSLWLISMDPGRPFTFLDDRLVTGDSLLGIASLDQLEALHMIPERGRALHRKWKRDPTASVRKLLADLAEARTEVAAMPGETLEQLEAKRAKLAETERYGWRLKLLADLVAGSALATAPRGVVAMDESSHLVALRAEDMDGRSATSEEAQRGRHDAEEWLNTAVPGEADRRHPLHWPLEFPEVFSQGGFDGIVGNPPFLGGKKITGIVGTAYREYLVTCLSRSARGSADLVAYFVLRVQQLLSAAGQAGLIATNTLAQGDTREVGLDQLVADGVTIKAAVKSEPWPSRSAVLEYCAVWTSRRQLGPGLKRPLDGQPVLNITSSLDAGSRVAGGPKRLGANAGIAFQGSVVLGMGFMMEPERAEQLIEADRRNADVLFPYLNGQDLNSRPDCSASRWVINFHDWSEERARSYPVPFSQALREVKPQRDHNPKRSYRERWWQFGERCPGLYRAIATLNRVIAITLVSKVVMPVMVPTGHVFAHRLAIFASGDPAMLALLDSCAHYWWGIEHSSTLESRVNYAPSDAFETFARPEPTEKMRHLGDRLDRERRDLMLSRHAGLTAIYNMVHDPSCSDADIVNLREIHRAIDHGAFEAYGWIDLELVHDHFETRQGVRWTIDPVTRQEMLVRLLELNHERYAVEQGKTVEEVQQEGLF
jgi:hypothetical protein